MTVKPEVQAALGGASRQIATSLDLLNKSTLTENQRFHLQQIEQVLCTDAPQEEEP